MSDIYSGNSPSLPQKLHPSATVEKQTAPSLITQFAAEQQCGDGRNFLCQSHFCAEFSPHPRAPTDSLQLHHRHQQVTFLWADFSDLIESRPRARRLRQKFALERNYTNFPTEYIHLDLVIKENNYQQGLPDPTMFVKSHNISKRNSI